MCRLVDVLEAPPSAHVIYENGLEVKFPVNNILEQLLKTRSVPYSKATSRRVGVGLYDLEVAVVDSDASVEVTTAALDLFR